MFSIKPEQISRYIVETSSEGVWIIDGEMKTQFVNKRLAEMLGYTPEEMIDTNLIEYVFEEDKIKLLQRIERRRQGVKEDFDFRYRRKDGSPLWAKVSANPLFDEADRFIGAVGMFTDISERKEYEQRLEMSEERYRAFIEQSSEGIWRFEIDEPIDVNLPVDKQIKLIYKNARLAECNDAMARQYGFASAEEMEGIRLSELFVTDDAKNYEILSAFIKSGYRLNEAESHEKDNQGNDRYFLNSFIGFVENGYVIRAWGMQRDITERKQVEETLRESEERYRALVEASAQTVWTADAEAESGGHLKWFSHLAGKRFAEINEQNFWELIHPKDRDYLQKVLHLITKKPTAYEVEFRLRRENADYCYYNVRGAPIFNFDGSLREWIGTIRDITNRKEGQIALRQSEESYRILAETASDAIIQIDEDSKILFVNNAAEAIFGYEIKEMLGQPLTMLMPEHLREKHLNGIRRYVKTGKRNVSWKSLEIPALHKDGRIFPLEISFGEYKQDKKRLFIGIARDITERKKAEDKYQELLQRIVPLAQTLGTARDLISIYRSVREFVSNSMSCSAFFVSFYDARSNMRTAAYAWGEKGEVDISELPPLELTEDGGPNSQAVFQKRTIVVNHYMNFMEKRPHITLQENGVDPQTSLVVPMIVMNRVVGTLEVQAYENDAFNRGHIVALEMAANLAAVAVENVRLLQIEAQARETAEAANRAKDEFLSVLSHELRTPLNAMLGWVRMLRTGMLDEERSRQAVEVIERNTRLQNSLIEDLLDVSRIISGKMRIDKEEVDLVAVAENSFETLRPSAESKNINFNFSAEAESLPIEGDTTRLNQIIGNLIQNAVKFTPEGGSIDVALKHSGNRAQLIVKDSGIGIEPEVLPFIFERFRQADASTRRNFSGLGLGLTIVSNLVELHGGNVKAESGGKGLGATFTVELPVIGNYQNQKADYDLPKEDNFALKGARILLVDDDADGIIPLQMLLEKEKAEIVTVFSADEALEKLTGQKFHILISDIGMPEMDGYDLIARIRQLTTEQNAFLPAVALTAYASNEDRRRALSAGFQMHFSKPFDFDELLTSIIKLYNDSA